MSSCSASSSISCRTSSKSVGVFEVLALLSCSESVSSGGDGGDCVGSKDGQEDGEGEVEGGGEGVSEVWVIALSLTSDGFVLLPSLYTASMMVVMSLLLMDWSCMSGLMHFAVIRGVCGM